MSRLGRSTLPQLAAALLAAAISFPGAAHAAEAPYTPQIGQEGKDVIWVPTPQELVDRMLAMAQVQPSDYVIDLGSGDGRTVITAAKRFGARALGIEYNPNMVALSQRNAEKAGVADRAQFRRADIFATDLSAATVITLYLLPTLNLKLRPTILDLKPGTRIVSHAFSMDDWPPDETENINGRTAYLWIVPAQLAGAWRIDVAGPSAARYELELRQRFQHLDGQAKSERGLARVRDGRIRGEAVSFTLVDASGTAQAYSGRLANGRLEGADGTWTGTRAK